MDVFRPFMPIGPQMALMASNPASPSVAASGVISGLCAYLVTNMSSTVDAYLAHGATSGMAKGNSVVPLIGTPSATVSVPRNTTQSFTFPARSWFSGVTAAGQCVIFITPGQGL